MASPRTATSRANLVLLVCLLASASALADAGPTAAPSGVPVERLRKAVVAVRATEQSTNWRNPWKKLSPKTSEFNGLVVEGNAILVPALDLVGYTLIEVQRLGEQSWVPAKVELIDYDLPLALLKVEEAGFWNGLEPLPLAATVPTGGEVQLASWQSGKFEVATGTVARLEVDTFGYGRVHALALRLASSATSSVHGEAVVAGGQLVGMVMDSQKDALTAVASSFLGEFRHEATHTPYRGFARVGLHWQNLTNPALRESLGLRPEDGGVLIMRILPQGGAAQVLQPRDIVLEVAGHKIDASGRFEHPNYGPTRWSLLLTEGKRSGDTVDFLVLRDGQRRHASVPLKRWGSQDDRIPHNMVGQKPDFVVAGGLVFQALSAPYLTAFPNWRVAGPPRLVIAYELDGEWPSAEHPKTVVLTLVLPDPANLGYQELHDLIVDSVNGVQLKNLDDLRMALTKPVGRNHIIEFQPGQGVHRIVLDVDEVKAAEQRVQLD
jgi:S1-C subfamily serine protease